MQITEIRIKLVEGDPTRQRLRAFCSVTFDDAFVARDLKVLEGDRGFFVAMPSRKVTHHCPHCHQKNSAGANYCNNCGKELGKSSSYGETNGFLPSKMYVDIVHPINTACREYIHREIINAYEKEVCKSRLPGYVSSYDDWDF